MLNYSILKKSNSIRDIIKNNKKLGSLSHNIFYSINDNFQIEIAFIAPKKMGNAVKRNFAKRRLRAAFRNITNRYKLLNSKLVLIANNNILKCAFADLETELILNFQKLQLVNDSID